MLSATTALPDETFVDRVAQCAYQQIRGYAFAHPGEIRRTPTIEEVRMAVNAIAPAWQPDQV
jgi:hypothetical protein